MPPNVADCLLANACCCELGKAPCFQGVDAVHIVRARTWRRESLVRLLPVNEGLTWGSSSWMFGWGSRCLGGIGVFVSEVLLADVALDVLKGLAARGLELVVLRSEAFARVRPSLFIEGSQALQV